MIDFENSTDKNEVIEYARILGLDPDGRLALDKIKELIRSALAENAVDTSDAVEQKAQYKFVTVQIHKTEGDTGSDDVPVSVNGKTWLIKRGFDVQVPDFIVEVLKNAVKDVYEYDTKTNKTSVRQVPAYPFSVS